MDTRSQSAKKAWETIRSRYGKNGYPLDVLVADDLYELITEVSA